MSQMQFLEIPEFVEARKTGEPIVVEVQLGDYTGEDDICRIEDDYGRTV